MRLKAATLGAAAIGFVFLLSGVGAYLRLPSATTRLLALWTSKSALPGRDSRRGHYFYKSPRTLAAPYGSVRNELSKPSKK